MIDATFDNLPTVNVELADAHPAQFTIDIVEPNPITIQFGVKGDKGDQGIQGIQGDLGNLQVEAPLSFNVSSSVLSIGEYYLPLTGGIMSGVLKIQDNSYTLENGLGYSWAYDKDQNGNPKNYAVIYPNGVEAGNGEGDFTSINSSGVQIYGNGSLKFPDNTTQTTAATTPDLTPYLTSSTASTTYYPLNSNPAGYLTSSSLTNYATNESVDTKISNLVGSAPETLNTLNEIATALNNDANLYTTLTGLIDDKADASATQTALDGKLSLTGGTMSGAIGFDPVGGQNIAKGSFDSGRGGYNGISLNCAVGYELNWQAGYLKAKQIGGGDVPINVESDINTTGGINLNDGIVNKVTLSTDGSIAIRDNSDSENYFPSLTISAQGGLYGWSLIGGDGTELNNYGNWSFGYHGIVFNNLYEGLSFGFTSSGINFADATTQTTAWTGYSGDTSQYIAGDGSLQTFPTIPSLTGYATESFVTSQGYITSSALSGYATQSYVTSQGYITSSALTPYLTSATASSTYQTLAGMSSYLTTANASSTYLTQSSASSTYLTQSSASATYFPKPAGTSLQYIDGTGSLQTFPTISSSVKTTLTAYNQTGATITKGSVVYISSAHGNDPQVSLSRADAEATSAYTIGVAQDDIPNATNGTIITSGLLENFATNTYGVDGTPLYLSSTVYGGLTATKQWSPNHYVKIGTVVRSHPTLGSVYIKIENGYQLDELSDCYVTSPTNNNVLTFESSTSLWKDKSIATILGYTPANGTNYLAKADNLSGLANTATARTNLGLGSASTLASSAVAQTANNLSDLQSASTARTNLGLGSASTLASSAVLQTANNLSEVTPATARTNLGLTSVATASFATTDQAQAGTSTTTVINPSNLREMLMTSNVTKLNSGLGTATTGTGGTNDGGGFDFHRLLCPNSASNVIVTRYRAINMQKGGSLSANMTFANGVALAFRLSLLSTTGTDPNSTGVIAIGETTVTTAVLPSVRSIGIQLNYGSNIKILAHDGTTLTTYTTSTSVASLYVNACDFLLTNDYATGTVTLYLNGVSIGSTTGGVTTHSGGFNGRSHFNARAFNTSVPSGSQLGFIIYGATAIVL